MHLPRERKTWDLIPSFFMGIYPGWFILVTSKSAFKWLPCKAPGIIGSVLGLVGLLLVYCDWVRHKVWSITSISVWQYANLSEQIRPWDHVACCWDAKQPTNTKGIWPQMLMHLSHTHIQQFSMQKKEIKNTIVFFPKLTTWPIHYHFIQIWQFCQTCSTSQIKWISVKKMGFPVFGLF